jgi:arsenate reductase
VEEYRHASFDLVIILCGQDDDQCPVWLGRGKRVHHPYPDPALAPGAWAEKIMAYRAVRDRMLEEIPKILELN